MQKEADRAVLARYAPVGVVVDEAMTVVQFRGRTAPYLIRKWPGSRVALPMGPYTLTQLVILVGSVALLIRFADWWAFFGGFNVVIGVGAPIALTSTGRSSS